MNVTDITKRYNAFPTKEQAQKVAEKIKRTF